MRWQHSKCSKSLTHRKFLYLVYFLSQDVILCYKTPHREDEVVHKYANLTNYSIPKPFDRFYEFFPNFFSQVSYVDIKFGIVFV